MTTHHFNYTEIEEMDLNTLKALYKDQGVNLFNIETKTGTIFSPQLLAMYLYRTQPTVTMRDNGHMYVYDFKEGNYKGEGETHLNEKIRKILRGKYRKSVSEEVVNHIKIMTYKNRDEFKLPLNMIPVKNGILEIPVKNYNFQFSQLKLISNDPKYFAINRIPVSYDPEATCPTWDNFIKDIFYEADIKFIQEYIGYCFYRDFMYSKVFMLKGPPRTGKSTFLRTIISLLGQNNVVAIPLYDLQDDFALVQLHFKLANFLSDLSPKQIKFVEKFKQLTGNDLISARNLYEKKFGFINYAKFGWACNEIPVVKIDDDAYWIRWQIILVNKKQYLSKEDGRDLDLRVKLLLELPGILNWALKGLERLLYQRYFTNEQSAEEVRKLWHLHSDALGQFMYSGLVVFKSDGFITKDRLYDIYVDWCSLENISAISKEKMGRAISRSFKKRITSTYRGPAGEQEYSWAGIQEPILSEPPESMFEDLI